jgi:molybdopterin converting factor small subunit
MKIRKKLRNNIVFSFLLVFIFTFLVFNVSLVHATAKAVALKEFKNMSLEVSADKTETVNKTQVFWHDLKDTISLALTFDEINKIEKELKYAEKRIRWANILSSSDYEDEKDLAFELSAKADEYLNKIIDKSDIILNDIDARKENILENILIHQDNKAKVWEKLETNIAVENSEDFMRIREQIESKQQDFMKTISNSGELTKDLRIRFKKQEQNIKERRENRKKFIDRNRDQLDNLNTSNNSELKEFLEKRRQDMMNFNKEFQKEFDDVYSEKNKQVENKKQNHLQTEVNNSTSTPAADFEVPEYQQFLQMFTNNQVSTSTLETEK